MFIREKKKKPSTRNRKKLISHLFPSITNYNVYWQPEYTLCSLCVFSHQIQCITNAFGCRRAYKRTWNHIIYLSSMGQKLSFHQIINSWLFSLKLNRKSFRPSVRRPVEPIHFEIRILCYIYNYFGYMYYTASLTHFTTK